MSLPDPTTTEQNNSSQQQAQQPAQGAESGADDRQQAIEQEPDTARLRSERKSVEDGSGSQQQD